MLHPHETSPHHPHRPAACIPRPQPRFRLLLRGDLLEFYLNDHLIQSYALPEPATGRLGLIHNGNPDCIDQLEAWN